VQAGYLLDERWEVFGRYDFTMLDDEALAADDEDNVHEITVGANYYLYKHNAKFTLDFTYLPNGSPTNVTGNGILAGDEDQFVVRGQMQLAL
jgi:hypothetical protein